MTKCRWFQVHLSTAIVLILAACVLFRAVAAGEKAPDPPAPPDENPLQIGVRKDAPPALSALLQKLRAGNIADVTRAAQSLAENREARAVPALWELYGSGDAPRRLLAIRAIARIAGEREAGNLLKAALGDSLHAVRCAGIDELARLEGPAKAAERFDKTAADEKTTAPLQRFRAVQALGRIGGKSAEDVLARWLKSGLSELAQAAAEALGRCGGPSQVDALIAALETPDAELKPAVADALRRLTGQDFRFDIVQWDKWRKNGRPLRDISYDDAEAERARQAPIDLLIVFDTTASMLHSWPDVCRSLDAVLDELGRTHALRVGTIKYRAPDAQASLKYVLQPRPLSRQLETVRKELKDASFGGGSGAVHLALAHAVGSMNWRADARRVVVIVGDCAPAEDLIAPCRRLIAEAWRYDRVLVSTLYVRTQHGEEQLPAYRAMAEAGGGRFYIFDKAERRLAEVPLGAPGAPATPATELAPETAAKWISARKNAPALEAAGK